VAQLSTLCSCGTAWAIGVAQTFTVSPTWTCCANFFNNVDYQSWQINGNTWVLGSASPTSAGYASTSVDTTYVLTTSTCPDYSALLPQSSATVTCSSTSVGGVIALVIICTLVILGAIVLSFRQTSKSRRLRSSGDNTMPSDPSAQEAPSSSA